MAEDRVYLEGVLAGADPSLAAFDPEEPMRSWGPSGRNLARNGNGGLSATGVS